MGTKYSSQTISGYNATPPADDGTAVEANRTTWAKHKDKLADPIRVLSQAINTALLLQFDESVLDKGVAYTTVVADHKRTINVTALATQSLGDAATMAVGYIVFIHNSHTVANTVDLATGADTLNGIANGSLTIDPNSAVAFVVNSGADGYIAIAGFKNVIKGADIASTAALPFQSSAYADVTGTTDITSILTSGVIGTVIKRHFDGILTLTHDSADLILPGGSDIITAAGDEAEFVEYAAGDWILTNYIGAELRIEAYSEDADQYTATTGTRDLDVAVATYFFPSADLGTATITFTFSNPAASGRVSSFTMEMLGADGATLTWPASVDWPIGVEPTWTSGRDIITFVTRDGGTTWYGFAAGLAMS